MPTRQTHTYATLDVTDKAYDEIAAALLVAGYDHLFMEDGAIDMHGIALVRHKRLPAGTPIAEGFTEIGDPQPIQGPLRISKEWCEAAAIDLVAASRGADLALWNKSMAKLLDLLSPSLDRG